MPDLVSPAEVPVEMNAFKSQQHRWAKGSIQTCRKLLPRILPADLPLQVKAEAFFHLTANFNYLLMVLLSVLMFPSMYVRYNMGWTEMLLIDMPLFFAATFSVANFYMVCQRELFRETWISRLKYLPFLMSIGIGLCINNARAVIEALAGKDSGEFTRTPKYGIERDSDDWQGKKYHQISLTQPLIEVCARLLLHGHGVLRAVEPDLRHAAVPGPLPGRLPLHGPAVDRPAVRRRRHRAEHAGGRRVAVLARRRPPSAAFAGSPWIRRRFSPHWARGLAARRAAVKRVTYHSSDRWNQRPQPPRCQPARPGPAE